MARKSIKSDAVKLKGETAKKAPPLPAGADQPTNYAEQQGHGGETRQTTSDAALTMTTQQGIPVADTGAGRAFCADGEREGRGIHAGDWGSVACAF